MVISSYVSSKKLEKSFILYNYGDRIYAECDHLSWQ